MRTRKPFITLVAVASVTCWAVNAQEFAYEKMTGVNPIAPLQLPVVAYGGDPQATFTPKSSFRPRSSASRKAGYCVRLCDGRYFPAPSVTKKTITEGCKTLCPASETQVFYGSTIEGAYSQKGQAYSTLANAFRHRKELVDGCRCNGKNVVGLARIKPEDDGTLRQGDMLATADGMKVVRTVIDGEARLAATSNRISSR